jgi:hypothetical protein
VAGAALHLPVNVWDEAVKSIRLGMTAFIHTGRWVVAKQIGAKSQSSKF